MMEEAGRAFVLACEGRHASILAKSNVDQKLGAVVGSSPDSERGGETGSSSRAASSHAEKKTTLQKRLFAVDLETLAMRCKSQTLCFSEYQVTESQSALCQSYAMMTTTKEDTICFRGYKRDICTLRANYISFEVGV